MSVPSQATQQAGAPQQSAIPQLATPFGRVKVSVQIMLGSTTLKLTEILALKAGSAIALDQKLGESVSVIVNNCCVARGELYVLEEDGNRLGVRITELTGNSDAGDTFLAG